MGRSVREEAEEVGKLPKLPLPVQTELLRLTLLASLPVTPL